MSDEEARKLAAWLDSPPGTAPPEELDPEVLGAVYTLRPERAPAPRVGIHEILAGLERGPLATPRAAAEPEAKLLRFPAPKRRMQWFALAGASGGLLAAAAAALLFIPVANRALAPEAQVPAAAVSPEPPPPTVAEAAPAAAKSADKAPGGEAEAGPGLAPASPVGGAPAPLSDAPAAEAPAERKADADDARAADPAPVPVIAEAASRAQGAPAPTDAAPPREKEVADEMSEADRLEALGYLEASGADAAPASAPAKSSSAAPAPAAAASGSAEEVQVAKKAKTESRREASDREAAVPQDYDASWYSRYPDVAAAYARGDYTSLLGDSRVDVAMDACWRAATAAWRSGDLATARRHVAKGLARSSANTVFRSQLLLLEGDLAAAAGDASGAASSWKQAAKLNQSR